MSNPVINWPDPTADHFGDWDAYSKDEVRKIVLGPSPGTSNAQPLQLDLIHLAEKLPQFKILTHLYLWQITGLKTLAQLPEGLQCLDVRGCDALTRVTHFPSALECLVLTGSPALAVLPEIAQVHCPRLRDLELHLPAPAISEDWLQHLLTQAPELQELDLSGCRQLTRLPNWPLRLRRAKFNGCTRLEALPDYWPEGLTRLELSGTAIEELPELLPTLDYLNLAGATKLKQLVKDWQVREGERASPRTLFLYRSGLLLPPASEQGESPTENVAASTRGYFEDVALTGQGTAKRCKVLMLGNGGAGKTSLSLALLPGGDPAEAKKLGSTHGVQFWDWACDSKVGGTMAKIHRHIWDFGGQEIYHNAHRLFMSAGAVFVVLWDPEQDGQVAPLNPAGYRDEWRPLRYWLDFLHLACPHHPRVVVVCSFQTRRRGDLVERFGKAAGTDYKHVPLLFVDSLTREGELPALHEWLNEKVVEVVETQGTAVPTYWEIAQNLVEGWVRRLKQDASFAADHNELPTGQFAAELQAEIDRVLRNDPTGRYRKLKAAVGTGSFTLTPDRVRRTLAFLTHSGWLFWDEKLFGQRVIVGQEWALQGIYAALERREGTEVYRCLRDVWNGQFTRERLVEIAWRESRYSPDQQRLLISFMERMGLCFTLVSEQESRWNEPVYVSLAHLKPEEERKLTDEFFQHPDAWSAIRRDVQAPCLHLGRWHAILAALGATHGTEAEYARDAFLLRENAGGQSVLIRVELEAGGIGGVLQVAVGGPNAAERAEKLATGLQALVDPAGSLRSLASDTSAKGPAGERAGKKTLFISYKCQPKVAADSEPDYEAPVNFLRESLGKEAAVLELFFDQERIRPGDNITAFLERIKETDRVVILHSDRYWKSPYCMYEFWQVLDSFRSRSATMDESLILLELASSGIGDAKTKEGYVQFWDQTDTMPSPLEKLCRLEQLKAGAVHHLRNTLPELYDIKGLNRRWDAVEKTAILAWVKERIGLD